ncbi:hypothetical protein PMAYCL1PPCAC_14874, partial [Pristionchus mayeri]
PTSGSRTSASTTSTCAVATSLFLYSIPPPTPSLASSPFLPPLASLAPPGIGLQHRVVRRPSAVCRVLARAPGSETFHVRRAGFFVVVVVVVCLVFLRPSLESSKLSCGG